MAKRFWLTTLAVVVVLGAGTTLVVTEGDDEDATTAVPDGPPPPVVTGPQPMVLPDQPTWTTEDFPAPGADGVAVGPRVALAYGPAAVQVMELRTGAVRWTLTRDTDLSGGARWRPSDGNEPRLLGNGPDAFVLTEYRRQVDGQRVEDGLVLLSAYDGQLLWLSPLTGPHPPSAGPVSRLRAADERVATATVDDEVIAVDLAAGDRLWTGGGGVPTAIAGDTLLSVAGGVLTTVDLHTGAPAWRPGYAKAAPVATAADVVAVHGDDELAVLDANTGQKLVDLGDPAAPRCVSDHESIACAAGGRVEVFNFWDGVVREVGADGALDAIMRGRIYLTSGDRHFTVDMDGRTVDDELPFAPALVADNHLVLTDGELFYGYNVGT